MRRAGRHVLSDRLQVLSAGIAFFAVLSIAPMLVTALSVYGAVNTPEQALDQLSRVAGWGSPGPHAGWGGAFTPTRRGSGRGWTFSSSGGLSGWSGGEH